MIPKFRVWEHDVKFMNDQVRITYNRFGDNKIFVEVTEGFGWKDVDEKYLMQFTGLTDKNGKEIFEGDVVKFLIEHDGLNQPLRNIKYEIVIEDGVTLIKNAEHKLVLSMVKEDMEIIGNIHEHPELLIQPNE